MISTAHPCAKVFSGVQICTSAQGGWRRAVFYPALSWLVAYLHTVLWSWAGILLLVDGLWELGERYFGIGKLLKGRPVPSRYKLWFAAAVFIAAQAIAYHGLISENTLLLADVSSISRERDQWKVKAQPGQFRNVSAAARVQQSDRSSLRIAPIDLQWNWTEPPAGKNWIIRGLIFPNIPISRAQGKMSCHLYANITHAEGGVYPNYIGGTMAQKESSKTVRLDIVGSWNPTHPLEFILYLDRPPSVGDSCEATISAFTVFPHN